MIVTRNWLNEWIDLEGIDAQKLCDTFNAVGLEVDRLETIRIPEKIVVGKVLACEKHPDAEKLNVCQVDTGSDTRQIVCGASNVAAGQIVPVALEGAVMPQGLEIKPVKLRGVDSDGMICSSTELGLPKLEDGILVLDDSIGHLELGTPLLTFEKLNDDLIEIELTANRGDCLSIRGVARDLSAALDRPMRSTEPMTIDENRVGIGRLLQLDVVDELDVKASYHVAEIDAVSLPLCVEVRLGWIEESRPNAMEAWLHYVTHSTGVILRAYPVNFFLKNNEEKGMITIKRDENGFAAVFGAEKASLIGIRQEDVSRVSSEDKLVIVEASYIPPHTISQQMMAHKQEGGPLYYRTSRGSEPDLSLGIEYLIQRLETQSDGRFYGGKLEFEKSIDLRVVNLEKTYIQQIVGVAIEYSKVAQLLKNLGFDISKSQEERFVIGVPQFRHDIMNRQDIAEEIVRIVGIDNIPAKPLMVRESDQLDDDYHRYQKQRTYRQRAAQSGFYESVHFVFNECDRLKSYGFDCIGEAQSLLNPIAGTLDTLRPTLMKSLLDAASLNAKNGQKRIMLFELGTVFDMDRKEHTRLTLLMAGEAEPDLMDNTGKPASVDFARFSRKVSEVIGDTTLSDGVAKHRLAHPYQYANVWQSGVQVGELFKLHPTIQVSLDLPVTYLCEIDFDALQYGLIQAVSYSKFQASYRDLSLVMPQDMSYESVSGVITANKRDEVIRFYPVDRYQDEQMGASMSLTVRFVLQSLEKTLEEEDITSAMDSVLLALKTELGVTLR